MKCPTCGNEVYELIIDNTKNDLLRCTKCRETYKVEDNLGKIIQIKLREK